MDTIQKRLKIARKKLKLTQFEMAEHCQLLQKDISRLENGVAKFIPNEYLSVLLDYGIDLNWLISGKGEILVPKLAENESWESEKLSTETSEKFFKLREKYLEASIENKMLKKQVKELKKEKNVLMETFKILKDGKLFK